MKQVLFSLALMLVFVNAGSAQIVDTTQVGNSVMINLNYQSLDSIIRALESRIESLEDSQDLDGDGVRSNQDCDDDDAAVGAERLWYQDVDGDLYGGLHQCAQWTRMMHMITCYGFLACLAVAWLQTRTQPDPSSYCGAGTLWRPTWRRTNLEKCPWS